MRQFRCIISKFDENFFDEYVLVRLSVNKNNIVWSEDNKKIHYSVERFFKRDGEFTDEMLNQEGAFVDILRVVNFSRFLSAFDH